MNACKFSELAINQQFLLVVGDPEGGPIDLCIKTSESEYEHLFDGTPFKIEDVNQLVVPLGEEPLKPDKNELL